MKQKEKQKLLHPTIRQTALFRALDNELGNDMTKKTTQNRVIRHIANEKRFCVLNELKYFLRIGIVCSENDKYLMWTKVGRRIKKLVLLQIEYLKKTLICLIRQLSLILPTIVPTSRE